MGRSLLALTAAAATACALVSTARAGWPTPAAGPSASGDPEVIFTFDDGPHEIYTPRILDVLAEHEVQAIFYWVGRRVARDGAAHRRRKAVIDRALREGHLIGNHTVRHVHLCQGTPEEAASEIDRNRNLLESLTGIPMLLFRAPYGNHCKRLKEMLRVRGLDHLHWDIDPREYLGRTADDTAAFVIGRLRHLEGRAVILMHDTKPASARALPVILDWIAAENRRRVARGARPIRVVGGSDLVAERSPIPLWGWGLGTASAAGARTVRALAKLVPGARISGALSLR